MKSISYHTLSCEEVSSHHWIHHGHWRIFHELIADCANHLVQNHDGGFRGDDFP